MSLDSWEATAPVARSVLERLESLAHGGLRSCAYRSAAVYRAWNDLDTVLSWRPCFDDAHLANMRQLTRETAAGGRR